MRRFFAPLLIAIIVTGGCAEGNGVLIVESGPPFEHAVHNGRMVPVFRVHVGEKVRMTFDVRVGACDYAVVRESAGDTVQDCGPTADGRFEWSMTIDSDPNKVGRRLLTVSGYVLDGRRDTLPVDGKLVERDGGPDSPDSRVAVDRAFVDLYESVVEFTVPPGGEKPDWSLSRIKLIRDDGARTRLDCDPQKTPGLKVEGPDPQGAYRVTYHPKSDEVNHQGQTRAELVVADQKGKTTTIETSFETP